MLLTLGLQHGIRSISQGQLLLLSRVLVHHEHLGQCPSGAVKHFLGAAACRSHRRHRRILLLLLKDERQLGPLDFRLFGVLWLLLILSR